MSLNRIACVEDESDIRDLVEIALSSVGGFEVRTFASGAAALEGLPNFAPDLILLDVMMPEMDGRELYSRLSAVPALEKIPRIFMTAKSMESEVQELRDLGAIGIISKPFDPMCLPDELRGLWMQTGPCRLAEKTS